MKVAFFFPSQTVGGTELISFRLAREFYRRGAEILIVDYPEGYLPQTLKKSGIAYIHVHWPLEKAIKKVNLLKKGDILFMYHFHIPLLPVLSHLGDPTVLICEMQKDIWYRLQAIMRHPLLRYISNIWKIPYQGLVTRRALCVLEADSLSEIQKCGIFGIDERQILPIPMDGIPESPRLLPPSGPPHYCSIGWDHPRKILPAGWAFSKILAQHSSSASFSYICRDPNRSRSIFAEHYPDILPRLHVFQAEGSSLTAYLQEKVCVYLGMGTSVLDAGKIGVPALILYSTTTNRYPNTALVRFLHTNNLENLGCPKPDLQNGVGLIQALQTIEAHYEEYARLSWSYVRTHHSVDSCVRKLMHLGFDCHFSLSRWRDVPGLRTLVTLIRIKACIKSMLSDRSK